MPVFADKNSNSEVWDLPPQPTRPRPTPARRPAAPTPGAASDSDSDGISALTSRLRQLARQGEAADLGAAELEELIDAVGEAVRGWHALAGAVAVSAAMPARAVWMGSPPWTT